MGSNIILHADNIHNTERIHRLQKRRPEPAGRTEKDYNDLCHNILPAIQCDVDAVFH